MFQRYALFHRISVRQNVEYGLRMRRVPAGERSRQVDIRTALVGAGLLVFTLTLDELAIGRITMRRP